MGVAGARWRGRVGLLSDFQRTTIDRENSHDRHQHQTTFADCSGCSGDGYSIRGNWRGYFVCLCLHNHVLKGFRPMTISQNSRNWLKSSWTRFFTIAIMVCITLLVSGKARAQDVNANCRNAASCILTPNGGIPWANGNLTFIFTPIAPHASIYIYLHNNNPSNAHTSQSIQVFTTPFVSTRAPSLSQNSDLWVQDTVTQNSTAGASCNNLNANGSAAPGAAGMGSCYVMATFASQVAIKMTGAAAQAGSPDTYDLVVVQEPSVMGSSNPGSPSNGLTSPNSGPAATLPIQVVSDNLGSAFGVSGTITTSSSTLAAVGIFATNATKSIYLDKAYISSTIAATVNLFLSNSAGTGAADTVFPLRAGSAISSIVTANQNYSLNPGSTGTFVMSIAVPAQQTIAIDLRGWMIPQGTSFGLAMAYQTALSGGLTGVFQWYEKAFGQ